VEEVFRALADDSRRTLLDRLFQRDGQTLAELVEGLGMTRFGVMKHLHVLEAAGLITTRRAGREKFHYLNPVPIRLVHDRWISKYAVPFVATLADLKHRTEAEPMDLPTHVFEIYIASTPERLWHALTDPGDTRNYYFSSEVESTWEPGAALVYRIGDDIVITGEVIECQPPSRLVGTFDARWDAEVAPDAPSRMTWEIIPMGPSCRLTVTHDGFASETATVVQVRGGLPLILSGLKTWLETGMVLEVAG
jgi:uncharacterized protein YndB with AHSA1/START domain